MTGKSQSITIRLTIEKVKKNVDAGDADNEHRVKEKTIHAPRDVFLKIKSKDSLTAFLNTKLNNALPKQNQLIKYTRKSKKHKDYIALDNEEDFKSLSRSLKVKNHVKLKIEDHSSPADFAAAAAAAAAQEDAEQQQQQEEKGQGQGQSNSFEFDLKKKINVDFAKFGDALIELAFEHFRELFGNSLDLINEDKGKKFAFDAQSMDSKSESLSASSSGQKSPNLKPEKNAQEKEAEAEEKKVEEVVHQDICCDQCSPVEDVPLKGTRYTCLVCENYDLCSNCESKQQAGKLNYGKHLFEHPMARIVSPMAFAKPNWSGRKNFCSGFGRIHRPFTRLAKDDIIYDIPLSQCNAQNREKLTQWLNKSGIQGFMKEIDNVVHKSELYDEVLSLLESFCEDDLETKHLVVMGLVKNWLESGSSKDVVDAHNSTDADDSSNSTGSKAEEDVDVDVDVDVAVDRIEPAMGTINTQKSGFVAKISKVEMLVGKIVLQLINRSNQTIRGGDMKFELYKDETEKEKEGNQILTFIKNASDVKPGQIKFYKLGKIPKDFEIKNTTFKISAPELALKGTFACDSEIELALCDDLQTGLTNEVTQELPDGDGDAAANSLGVAMVNLDLKPNSLVQLKIVNNLNRNISGEDLKLKLADVDENIISNADIESSRDIAPGKSSKFNLTWQDQKLRYPIKFTFENRHEVGTCEFREGALDAVLVFHNKQTLEVDDSEVTDAVLVFGEELTEEKTSSTQSHSSLSQSASFHSVVLPSLPRESNAGLQDVKSEVQVTEAGAGAGAERDDDYEMLDSDDESLDSDFEILSVHSSNS
ncbi:uncharacterized protein LODBEIA_P22650 [Lodderomyces beijingensis]|uniref:ZZ-type domain-containing protein n=1 Tax=Lodderomyces beijingensis TaxID=1775926 RepID=A0ABP0ZMD5_9ASCO